MGGWSLVHAGDDDGCLELVLLGVSAEGPHSPPAVYKQGCRAALAASGQPRAGSSGSWSQRLAQRHLCSSSVTHQCW